MSVTTKLIGVTSLTKDSPGAGQFTLVGTYANGDPGVIFGQSQTINEFPEDNDAWSRAIRLTDQYLFVQRNGSDRAAITVDLLSQLARLLVANLSWTPKILTQPVSASCVASSSAAGFTIDAISEDAGQSYQWQYKSRASAVLTSDNNNTLDGGTVVLGAKTYTFKNTLTPTEGEVLVGANADASLLNLIRAVNHTGTPDTDYKCAAANADIVAVASVTSHTATFVSRSSETTANALASTETSAHLSFPAVTLLGAGTWTSASGTVNGCAFSNGTTATLTATPTSTIMSATPIRCVATNAAGTTTSSEVVLTIT